MQSKDFSLLLTFCREAFICKHFFKPSIDLKFPLFTGDFLNKETLRLNQNFQQSSINKHVGKNDYHPIRMLQQIFHLVLFLFFLCFNSISIHYHTQKQNKKLPEIKSILRFLTMKHDIHSTELEDIQYSVRFQTNSRRISCIKNKPAR